MVVPTKLSEQSIATLQSNLEDMEGLIGAINCMSTKEPEFDVIIPALQHLVSMGALTIQALSVERDFGKIVNDYLDDSEQENPAEVSSGDETAQTTETAPEQDTAVEAEPAASTDTVTNADTTSSITDAASTDNAVQGEPVTQPDNSNPAAS